MAARTIARRPWQPIVVALTLATAIAAVGLTLATVYGVVIRPLVYRDAGRVVVIRDATDLLSANDADALLAATTLESIAAFRELRPTLRDGDRTRRLATAAVAPSFFAALGLLPQRGRVFLSDDFSGVNAPIAIVSDAVARRWQSSGTIVGATIFVDGEARTVVGVMPATFDFPSGAEIWTPLRGNDARRDDARFEVVARLKPGVEFARARAEVETIGRRRRIAGQSPQPFHVDPLDVLLSASARPAFWLTVGIVMTVFVLTMMTLANLFVARAIARSRDIAIHTALGGTPGQLFRQQLSESALVCAAGTLIGTSTIVTAARVLPTVFAGREWMPGELVVDWRVLVSVVIVAVIAAGVLAIATVVRLKDIDVQAVLRSGAVVTASARQRHVQNLLLAVELAMVMFLAMTAGTLAQSYLDSEKLDWGYDARRIVFGTVALPQSRFALANERLALAGRVGDALRAARIRGEVTVFAESFPGWNADGKTPDIEITGGHRAPVGPHATMDVDTAYFTTMGVRLLAGRGIVASDVAGSIPVIVVDERFAQLNWPAGDAIGQQLRFPEQEPNGPWYTVVGIASRANEISFLTRLVVTKRIGRPTTVYRALAQVNPTWPGMGDRFAPGFAFAIHVSSDVSAAVGRVRDAVRRIAPDQPIEHVGTLQAYFNGNGLEIRARATVFALAFGFGVVLCMLGVVGLVSDNVARRTREIGVRIALGSPRSSVIAFLLQNTLIVAVIGVAAGLAASIVAVRSLGHLVFGVGGGVDNPIIVLGGIAGTLGIVAVAAMGPASRAAAVDPVVSLRAD